MKELDTINKSYYDNMPADPALRRRVQRLNQRGLYLVVFGLAFIVIGNSTGWLWMMVVGILIELAGAASVGAALSIQQKTKKTTPTKPAIGKAQKGDQ